jgi:nickel-dependent lactate racemase
MPYRHSGLPEDLILPEFCGKIDSMTSVRIAYGKGGLTVQVPEHNLRGVLSMRDAVPLENPAGDLPKLLEHPIGSRALAELAGGAGSACVAICDITRPVPNRLLLPPVLDTLRRSGIAQENILILVATGLHRESTPEELSLMLGESILGEYRVSSHNARNAHEHAFLGVTASDTPVFIDRRYCGADLKITTGFIEPHLMAGFSGGRKLVAPGLAGEETIKALHSPRFLENPRCAEGSITDNPLHMELLEIARRAGHDFLVNVSLDESHAVTGIFAGDPLAAHADGVEKVRSSVRARLDEPADIVITSAAGYPLDLTFYQAVKGMTAALPAVRKHGVLIIAAECAEGLGSREFTEMAARYSSAETFLRDIARNPVTIDQWQLEECAKAVRQAEVVLVSPVIARRYGGRLFVRVMETAEEALEFAFSRVGRDASVAVIPKGPYTLVEVGN